MTEQPKVGSTDELILAELKKMNKVLALSNAKKLEEALAEYANTDDRKKVWVLISNKNLPQEIAQKIGRTKRAVDIFLQILEDAELVERPYAKPPKRLVDHVPASWAELLQNKNIQTLDQKDDSGTIENPGKRSEGDVGNPSTTGQPAEGGTPDV